MTKRVSIIASVSANGAIGKNNKLLCSLPKDMVNFVRITKNSGIVVMGRKTYESIGSPLPGRLNIVVSRSTNYSAMTFKEAFNFIKYLPDSLEVMIIGGEEIYRQFLPITTKMYITNIQSPIDGDAYFPEFNELEWRLTSEVFNSADKDHRFPFIFNTYERL